MTIKDLIKQHGGPASFGRALAAKGIVIPAPTIGHWSAAGKAARTPPEWIVELIRLALE